MNIQEVSLILENKWHVVDQKAQGFTIVTVAGAGRDLFTTAYNPDNGGAYIVTHWRFNSDLGWYPWLVNGQRCEYDGKVTGKVASS